jgi:hypothetical protein
MYKLFCRVGVKLPTVEVRYKNLQMEAECEVVHGKPLPTLWNAVKSMLSVSRSIFGASSVIIDFVNSFLDYICSKPHNQLRTGLDCLNPW